LPAAVQRFEDGGARWEVAERAPAGALAAHAGAWVGYREEADGPRARREVSATRVVFIVEVGPPIVVRDGGGGAGQRFRGGFVAGLTDRFAITEHAGRQEGVQLDLTPIGAHLLLGVPMHELAGRIVGLDELGAGAIVKDLADRLRDAPGWDARFDLLDRVFARRADGAGAASRMVAWAVAAIERAGGALSMRELARELGYSDKHVTRLFRQHVGVGPKRYARLVRLERVLAAAAHRPHVTWAELALDHGYCDQAHLARDVRELTGLTPSELRADRVAVPEGFQRGA